MTNGKTASGTNFTQIGAKCNVATIKIAKLITMRKIASQGFTSPVTIGRFVNLGLILSYFKSMKLFKANAALRAPTIATVIQINSAQDGTPFDAKNAPIYAKGKANIE